MISTCATCRWSKEAQLMPGWLICAPPLPPMLRRPAERQPMSWCGFHLGHVFHPQPRNEAA